MKQVLLVIALLLANMYKYLDNQGVILYEQKVNMHRRLPADDQEARQFIPEFQTSKMELLFNKMESLFRTVEEEEDEDMEMESGGVHIKMRRPELTIFRNMSEKRSVEQREFLGKKYLVEGDIAQTPWKITGESKEILGYKCQQAMYKDTAQNRKVVAWFTGDIPCPSGPEMLGSLPGMILEADVNDGEVVYTALKIDTKGLVDVKALKAPTSGKKMTREEFKNMVDEHMKQMGGGSGIRIIRN
jgi:GLPGLI family protein